MPPTATITIGEVDYPITQEQVLDATRYKRPPDGPFRGRRQYVTLRGRRVPARWALVTTLENTGTDEADREARRGAAAKVQTWHGVTAMRRLGFTTGTDET